MAIKQIVIDDITGEEGASERTFCWGQYAYEIDATEHTWADFEAIFEALLKHGRRIGKWEVKGQRAVTVSQREADTGKHSPEEREAVRAWMAENGIVENRQKAGRIGTDIWLAFRENDLSLLKPGRIPAQAA